MKGEVVSVHTMEAYGGEYVQLHSFLVLALRKFIGQFHASTAFFSRRGPTVTFGRVEVLLRHYGKNHL